MEDNKNTKNKIILIIIIVLIAIITSITIYSCVVFLNQENINNKTNIVDDDGKQNIDNTQSQVSEKIENNKKQELTQKRKQLLKNGIQLARKIQIKQVKQKLQKRKKQKKQ